MNEKSAREICEGIPKHNVLTIAEAKGYLSCLVGPEINAIKNMVIELERMVEKQNSLLEKVYEWRKLRDSEIQSLKTRYAELEEQTGITGAKLLAEKERSEGLSLMIKWFREALKL